jgi:hypothetical protein
MISNKQRTIALSTIAIAAVIVLFASGPLIAAHQAQAFFGHRFFGGFGFPGWWGGFAAAGVAAGAAPGRTVPSFFIIFNKKTTSIDITEMLTM